MGKIRVEQTLVQESNLNITGNWSYSTHPSFSIDTQLIDKKYVDDRNLDDLANVIITTPSVDQVLKYSGTQWVNGNQIVSSAGAAVNFYLDKTVIINSGSENDIKILTLTKSPSVTSEQEISAVVNNSTAILAAFLYDTALLRTQLDPGLWDFHTYAKVDDATDVSEVIANVYDVIIEPGTITVTGSGTSRTITASIGTPFVAGDANSDAKLASYIQTPKGLYQIATYLSGNSVVIVTPSGYSNESTVSFSKWSKSVQGPTGDINSTSYALVETKIVNSLISINTTDKLGAIYFVSTTATSNITVYLAYDGNTHYSFIATPLVVLHDDLAGLHTAGSSVTYGHITDAVQTIAGNKTFSGTTNLSALTASQLLALDGSKNITNLTLLPNTTTVYDQTLGDNSGYPANTRFVQSALSALSPSLVHIAGTETITGAKTFSSTITSNLTTGTMPLTITSTTECTNLNVNYLQGHNAAYFAQDSAVVHLTGTETIAGSKTFSLPIISILATGTAPFAVSSTTECTNLNVNYLQGHAATYFAQDSATVHLAGTETITGSKTFSLPIISNVSVGTAPLNVTSTTQCNNLNSNYLQGHDASYFAINSSFINLTNVSKKIDGLVLSKIAARQIQATPGYFIDFDRTTIFKSATSFTKDLNQVWAAGSGNGGRPSTVSLNANQWYNFFAIANTSGTVDFGFDISYTATNLLGDSGYNYYLCIGAIKTDSSSNIIDFVENEEREFFWENGGYEEFNITNPGIAHSFTFSYAPILNSYVCIRAGITINGNTHPNNTYYGVVVPALSPSLSFPTPTFTSSEMRSSTNNLTSGDVYISNGRYIGYLFQQMGEGGGTFLLNISNSDIAIRLFTSSWRLII